jgi:hypothetical protein
MKRLFDKLRAAPHPWAASSVVPEFRGD